MKNPDKATANYAKWFNKKKVNSLLLKLKTSRILQLAHLQSASSAKKNMGQISAGTYKQNVTTTMMLAILPSFVRKSHLQGLARLKTPLYVLEASSHMLINHFINRLDPTLSQAKTRGHLLGKWRLILEPRIIFSRIVHTFPNTKNIIMSSKPVPEKYLQQIVSEM